MIPGKPKQHIHPVQNVNYGPRVAAFDKAIAYLNSKAAIGQFIGQQQQLGRFQRVCPNPIDLGRVVLKHARKKIAKGVGIQEAVRQSGIQILDHYTSTHARKQVRQLYQQAVPDFSLALNQK